MTTGRDIGRKFDRKITALGKTLGEAETNLSRARARYDHALEKRANVCLQLADMRIDIVGGKEGIRALHDLDKKVITLLKQRDQSLEAYEKQLAHELKALDATLARVEQDENELAECERALAQAQSKSDEELSLNRQFLAVFEEADRAAAVAVNAREKASRAEAELDDKQHTYRDDPLFSYLWDRGFGTAAYSAGPVIRTLDGWVAHLCNFAAARTSFDLLNKLPNYLKEKSSSLTTRAEGLKSKAEAMRAESEKRHGVPALAKKVELAERHAHASRANHQARQDLIDELEDRLARFAGQEDKEYAQIQARLQGLIERIPRDDLMALARNTATDKDDKLVESLIRLDQDIEAAQQAIRDAEGDERRARDALNSAKAMRRKFKDKGYDNSRYRFRKWNDSWLDGYVAGTVTSNVLWSDISRSASYSSPSSSYSSYGSSSSSGGFGSGGGFGGGSFSSGGGFGGGGGFDTGGGF